MCSLGFFFCYFCFFSLLFRLKQLFLLQKYFRLRNRYIIIYSRLRSWFRRCCSRFRSRFRLLSLWFHGRFHLWFYRCGSRFRSRFYLLSLWFHCWFHLWFHRCGSRFRWGRLRFNHCRVSTRNYNRFNCRICSNNLMSRLNRFRNRFCRGFLCSCLRFLRNRMRCRFNSRTHRLACRCRYIQRLQSRNSNFCISFTIRRDTRLSLYRNSAYHAG